MFDFGASYYRYMNNPFMGGWGCHCNCNNPVNTFMQYSVMMAFMNNMFAPRMTYSPVQQPLFMNMPVQQPLFNYSLPNYRNNKEDYQFANYLPSLNPLNNNLFVQNNLNLYNIFKTSTTPTPSKSLNFNNTVKSSDSEFLAKVKQVAQNLNCDYKDLLTVINSESGFDTKAGYNRNTGKIAGAVGLIQFTRVAIEDLNKNYGLNLTKEKILNMSAVEQLDIAEKCLKLSKKYAGFSANEKLSATDLYAITFLPRSAKNEVLCQRGEGNSFYESNSALDYNGDGKITKSELAQRMERKRVDESKIRLVA